MNKSQTASVSDYKKDPYSKGHPCKTICCRNDLRPRRPRPGGCYDTKVRGEQHIRPELALRSVLSVEQPLVNPRMLMSGDFHAHESDSATKLHIGVLKLMTHYCHMPFIITVWYKLEKRCRGA